MYPKEQMLIFEASNGMIDSLVGDPMQVHVPIYRSLILQAFKRLGSDPQQYRGQSATLYSLTVRLHLSGSGQALPTNSNATSVNQWLVALRIGLFGPDQHT